MIESNDFKKNTKILIDKDPYTVVEFEHVKPGKGNAFTRCRLRNLKTGQILDRTYKNGEKFKQPDIDNKKMQYLYEDGSMLVFMDTQNFEQININSELLGKQIKFLKESMDVDVLFVDESPLNVEIPTFVELAISYCEPGFKGDTAQGANKPATCEGGHVCQVPLHLKEGDILKIDTRTGDYVEKVK